MAESEPKPRLIELVAPGAGQGWKAVLKNGKPAVVHEIPVPPAEAAAAIPRIQRLAEHRHPALSPVLAWGTDPNGIWVAVEPNEGTPLSTILSRGPLTPPAAAALGAAVLSGVAALHEAGIAMGGFGATAIRVTGNGDVRLAGHPAAAVRGAPAQSDLRADVRSSGMAVCAAFGVDPAGAPAPPNIPPGLVVTMRSMASGAMGPAADRAQAALREMASAFLAPDRAVASQSELALRAGGREMPSATPFLPKDAAAASPPPAAAAYAPPAPRDQTPIRAPVSYDAPPRSMQTYPSVPAPNFTGAPTPAAPAPAAPAQEPSIPTWSEAPSRTPFEAPPAAAPPPAPPSPPSPAQETFPPAPATFEPSPARSTFETAAPAASTSTNPPAPATFEPAPQRSTFETDAPAPAPAAFVPVAPSAAAPASPAAATPEAAQTWTPVEAPVWKPPAATSPVDDAPFLAAPVAAAAAAPVAPSPARTPTIPPSAPARKPTVARRPAGGGSTERPSWLIPAIIAIVVILLLGTVGGIVLAGRGKPGTGGVTTSPSANTSPKPSAKASPSPTNQGPLAVPNYGATSAAPITSVIICSVATPCNIGSGTAPETATACDLSSCKVEVGIYFSAPQRVPVSYIIKFFNRCTGETKDLPGPNAYTPPGYLIVIPTDHWPVSIPTGVKSAAIVAVAQQPAVAASAPLLLGGTSCA